jgi:hypothetical protein
MSKSSHDTLMASEFEAARSKEPRRGLKVWRKSKQAQKTEKWNVSLSNEVFGV